MSGSELNSEAPAAVEVPGAVVAEEAPCRGCGYLLRGISREGKCPECGRAVAESLGRELLRYRDPFWVHKVYRGTRVLVVAEVLMLVMVIVSGLGSTLVSMYRVSYEVYQVYWWGMFVMPLVTRGIMVTGVWMATWEAEGIQRQFRRTVSSVARWTALLGLALYVWQQFAGPWTWGGRALGWACSAVVTVSTIALWRWLGMLSGRVANDGIAWWGKFMARWVVRMEIASWVLGILEAVMRVGWGLSLLYQGVNLLWLLLQILGMVFLARLGNAIWAEGVRSAGVPAAKAHGEEKAVAGTVGDAPVASVREQ